MANRRRSFIIAGGGGGSVSFATQLVGTGGEINQNVSAATGSTNVKRAGRRRCFLGNADVSELKLWYAGWTVGTDTGEADIANSLSMRAHIEINGTSVSVPFSGVTTPVNLTAGADLISDSVFPSSFGLTVFPRGLEFYILTEQEVSVGQVFPTMLNGDYGVAVPGEAYLRADTAATTKIGTNGPIATGGGWIAGNEVWAPFAVLGKPTSKMMAVGILGASIEHGVNSNTSDGNGTAGGGFNRRALSATGGSIHIPHVNMARPSEKAATYVSSSTHRKLLYPYITHAICGHGGNDYSAGVTLAANIASNRSIHASIRTGNPACHITRLELYAKTDSTDGWTTQANQTPRTGMETGGAYRDPFNAAFAGDVGTLIDAFVLFPAGTIVDATNLDKWRTDIAATIDGTHPQSAVHNAMATAEAARWETLRNVYENGYVFDGATDTLVSGLGSPPNDTRKKLIDQTIRWLKNSALWTKLDVLGMIGDTQEISLRNWKSPGTFDATLAGTITYTADRQFATAGAASSYVETNFNPFTGSNQYTQNAASFGNWFRSATVTSSSRSGWFDGTDGVTTCPKQAGGVGFTFRINQASTSSNAGSGELTDGLFLLNRSGASAVECYSNGVLNTINTNPTPASTALNDHTFRLGVINSSGGIVDNYAAWTIGGSFSGVQADILTRILTSYMRKIGAV